MQHIPNNVVTHCTGFNAHLQYVLIDIHTCTCTLYMYIHQLHRLCTNSQANLQRLKGTV